MKIGEVLRSWRQKRDVDIRELAREVGVSHGTISRIERGEIMDAVTMMKLMRWLFEKPLTNGTKERSR